MVSRKPFTVPYRRKREKRTDYLKRQRLLQSRLPRLVVRISHRRIIAQIIEFRPQGDYVAIGMDSWKLKRAGWNSSGNTLPAAYALGLLIGREALQKGYTTAVLDTGFRRGQKGGRAFALLKGAVDAGLQVPHGDDIFPPEERIAGKHLKNGGESIAAVLEKLQRRT